MSSPARWQSRQQNQGAMPPHRGAFIAASNLHGQEGVNRQPQALCYDGELRASALPSGTLAAADATASAVGLGAPSSARPCCGGFSLLTLVSRAGGGTPHLSPLQVSVSPRGWVTLRLVTGQRAAACEATRRCHSEGDRTVAANAVNGSLKTSGGKKLPIDFFHRGWKKLALPALIL